MTAPVMMGGYCIDEAAARAGLSTEAAARLWRALGLPEVPADEATLTDDDVRMLELLGGVAPATAVREARLLGATMARLAAMGSGSDPDRAAELVRLVHQRHQGAARGPEASANGNGVALAVGFVDLVGFTAISRRLEDDELATLLTRFEDLTEDVVTRNGGRLVKTIGDEAMFVSRDPAAAARIGIELAEGHADDPGLPDVHVGLSYGPVLARDGDYFGAVVNLGRRITDVAPAGGVVASEPMHLAAAAHDKLEWKSLGPRFLKDLGGVPLWAVRPRRRPLDVLESLARGEIDIDRALKLIA